MASSAASAETEREAAAGAAAWCCTASWDGDSVRIRRIAGYDDLVGSDAFARVNGGRRFDLTQSPDWMEYLERSENRGDGAGGAGAYDTMRCDLSVTGRWNLWGEDFHVHRLRRSFLHLLRETAGGAAAAEGTIQAAAAQSREMLRGLLRQAERCPLLRSHTTAQPLPGDEARDVKVHVIRVTLLWSPSFAAAGASSTPSSEGEEEEAAAGSTTTNSGILVRGHACCVSADPVPVHRPLSPIQCTIAAAADPLRHHRLAVDDTVPARHDPEHKVASWTRLRKEMEGPDKYKPPGVSEVLMVRQSSPSHHRQQQLELLEGLTSNVFVVTKDDVLRTAGTGVLPGYVRHLVLDCAEACHGLRVDDSTPILLSDVDEWKEAFITSSSRLICPISRILVRSDDDDDGEDFAEFWRDPVLCDDPTWQTTIHQRESKPVWLDLLEEILRRHGYPLMSQANN